LPWFMPSAGPATGRGESESDRKKSVSMSKPLKPIPEFASEAEERVFWESPKNDSTGYVDWSKAKLVTFPILRPSTETISPRTAPL